MGSVKIVVPRGIRVELEGFVVMGSRDSKVDDDNALPGAPTLRVRGVTVMGSVDIVEGERRVSPELPRWQGVRSSVQELPGGSGR
jgi:hypothetical protein